MDQFAKLPNAENDKIQKWNPSDPNSVLIDISNLHRKVCFQKANVNVIKVLGFGISGVVYKACQYGNCNYALKVENRSDEKEFLAEIRKGKKAASAGAGPSIYKYFKCESSAGSLYMIMMDLMDSSLTGFLKKMGNLTITESKALIAIIEKLNRAGIIHNDLKPDNVGIKLAANGGMIKKFYLIDYGHSVDVSDPPGHDKVGWTKIPVDRSWIAWWDFLCLLFRIANVNSTLSILLRRKIPKLPVKGSKVVLPNGVLFPIKY